MTANTAHAGAWIDVKVPDGKYKAWHCPPVNPARKSPGILLIQEIFGVNEHIRGVAQQYALDGFSVLAPDVFWRDEPQVDLGYDQDGFSKGIALMNKANFAQTVKDLAAAVTTLRGLPDCSGKVAALGYCMGGRLAYLLAANSDINAAVAYYGGGIHTQLDQASKIRVPVAFHYGAKDPHIPADAVEAVRKTFGGRAESPIYVYEDADHGFNCWGRDSYNQQAAALARGRTLAFLAEHLSG